MISFIGFSGVAESRILPHGPQPPAVHGRLHAARVGIFARQPQLGVMVDVVLGRRVDVRERKAGVGLEALLAQRRLGLRFFCSGAPLDEPAAQILQMIHQGLNKLRNVHRRGAGDDSAHSHS